MKVIKEADATVFAQCRGCDAIYEFSRAEWKNRFFNYERVSRGRKPEDMLVDKCPTPECDHHIFTFFEVEKNDTECVYCGGSEENCPHCGAPKNKGA